MPSHTVLHCSGNPLPRRHRNPDARNYYCLALHTPQCVSELQAARQSALDHNVQAAFQHLAVAVALAADVAGMPSKCAPRRVVAFPGKPFHDTECRAAKRRFKNAETLQLGSYWNVSTIHWYAPSAVLSDLVISVPCWSNNTPSLVSLGNSFAQHRHQFL